MNVNTKRATTGTQHGVNLVALVDWQFIKLLYTNGSLVSATSRSLLKLDQAHIAVGGREHINTQKTL